MTDPQNIKEVVDVITSQSADVYNQYVQYIIWQNVVDIVITLSLLVIGFMVILLSKLLYKRHERHDDEPFWYGLCVRPHQTTFMIGAIMITIGVIGGFVAVPNAVFKITACYKTPKAVVIDHLVKQMK